MDYCADRTWRLCVDSCSLPYLPCFVDLPFNRFTGLVRCQISDFLTCQLIKQIAKLRHVLADMFAPSSRVPNLNTDRSTDDH